MEAPSGSHAGNNYVARCLSLSRRRYQYLKRLVKFKEMDFEFAMWQMLYLCISPRKVYRNFHYRHQTKHQWARDDPAFLVLLAIALCITSIGFAVILRLSFLEFIKFLFWVIFVDCIGVGLAVASLLWFISNRYLKEKLSHDNQESVEWLYSFDVHLNAFFPLLIVLHVIQLVLLPTVIDHPYFISRLVGNSLWLIALIYYTYITFLGYSALPFLKKTVVLLYPVLVFVLMYALSLIFGWNIGKAIIYFYRIHML